MRCIVLSVASLYLPSFSILSHERHDSGGKNFNVCNNGYSALGPVWQEPEPGQATGMALIRFILDKFFGVI